MSLWHKLPIIIKILLFNLLQISCNPSKSGISKAFKSDLPWQMKSIFIIVFFLLKCLVLPCFTHFFGFLQELQFSGNCSKSGKIRQFETKCSSFLQLIGSQFRGCRLPWFLNLLTIEKGRGCILYMLSTHPLKFTSIIYSQTHQYSTHPVQNHLYIPVIRSSL